MNQYESAISGAFKTLRSVAGKTVKYSDGTNWTELTAVEGFSRFNVDEGNGSLIETRSKDYIVSVCDLVLNRESALPKKGHTITQTIGNKEYVYSVSRPDGNEQVWRYSDSGQTNMRIHTMLVEVNDV